MLLGGLGLLVGSGLLIAKYFSRKEAFDYIEDEVLIEIAKRLRKEMFVVHVILAD